MSFFSWLKEVFTPQPAPPGKFYAQIQQQLLMLPEAERAAWGTLLDHCETANLAAPTAKWLKEARMRFDAVGAPAFVSAVLAWFSPAGREAFAASANLVKGLVWCCAFTDDERVSAALGDLGEASFRKVKNHGPVSNKVGNACIHVLGASSALHANAQLGRLKAATKYRQAQRMIDKAVTHAAEERGISKETLEELSAPSFEGAIPQTLGRWSPQLQFANGSLSVRWVRDDGKTAVGVPAEVKREHPAEVAAMKDHLKRMEKLLPGHAARLEHFFISDRALTVAQWRTRYVEHGLVGFLARALVWRFGDRPGLWFDGEVIDANGAKLEVDEGEPVRLWHPLGRSAEEVAALKSLVAKLGVEQPFAQVDREVCALTDVERAGGLSMRWAGRRLRQHPFHALCRERGWQYTLMGGWDSANTPAKDVPEWKLRVELQVDAPDEEMNPAGIYLYVTTGQLGLMRTDGPLAEVPAVVMSELLRDVERFVTTCAG